MDDSGKLRGRKGSLTVHGMVFSAGRGSLRLSAKVVVHGSVDWERHVLLFIRCVMGERYPDGLTGTILVEQQGVTIRTV